LPAGGVPCEALDVLVRASRDLTTGVVLALLGYAVVEGVALALLGAVLGAGLVPSFTVYLLMVLAVFAVFSVAAGYFFYRGGRLLREAASKVGGAASLGVPSDLVYFGGIEVLVGGLLSIVIVSVVLVVVWSTVALAGAGPARA